MCIRDRSNSGSAKTSILAVDIDGDGLPDLAMTSATGDAVAVLMGSNSDFFNSYGYGRGASPVAAVAGDFNGDGRVDLAVLNGKEGKVSILLGSPPVSYTHLDVYKRQHHKFV